MTTAACSQTQKANAQHESSFNQKSVEWKH